MTEEEVKQKFLEAFNTILGYRSELIDNCRIAKDILCDCSKIEAEIIELEHELEVVTELSRKAIYENAYTAINQDDWSDRNKGYQERYNRASNRITELKTTKRERLNRKLVLENFIQDIKSQRNTIDEFNDRLWMVTIDNVTILPDGSMNFRFKDGTEVCR